MKMITLFLPEKYLEMLDTLVASNLYPNRSEALRMATWKFLHESVSMLKLTASSAASKQKNTAGAKKSSAPATTLVPGDNPPVPSDIDEILHEIGAGKPILNAGADANTEADADEDPFDEIIREQQHA